MLSAKQLELCAKWICRKIIQLLEVLSMLSNINPKKKKLYVASIVMQHQYIIIDDATIGVY